MYFITAFSSSMLASDLREFARLLIILTLPFTYPLQLSNLSTLGDDF